MVWPERGRDGHFRDALDPSAVSRWDFEHALLVRQQLLVLENERLRLAAGVAEAEAAALAGHSSAAALPKPWRGATATRKVSHVSAASQNAAPPALYAAAKALGCRARELVGTLAPLAGELAERVGFGGVAFAAQECSRAPRRGARLATLDLRGDLRAKDLAALAARRKPAARLPPKRLAAAVDRPGREGGAVAADRGTARLAPLVSVYYST